MSPYPEDDALVAAWCCADPSRAALRERLGDVVARVRRAWPWYTPGAGFCDAAGAILASNPTGDDDADDDAVHWEDLALLDGFRRGIPRAASVMHHTVGARLVEVLVQGGADAADADDLVQDRLCALFDRDTTSYAARGPLIGWLRRSLFRDLGELRDKHERRARAPIPDPASAPVADLERAFAAHHHGPHLRAVLREVFANLDPQSRRILRLVYLGGLTAQQVGALVGLHRVTVQKKLGQLRLDLDRRVRRELAARFNLDESTVGALLDPAHLRFEASLSSVLASSPPL